MTMFLPSPALTLSPKRPAMMRSSPPVLVIVSEPPAEVVEVLAISSMSAELRSLS